MEIQGIFMLNVEFVESSMSYFSFSVEKLFHPKCLKTVYLLLDLNLNASSSWFRPISKLNHLDDQ